MTPSFGFENALSKFSFNRYNEWDVVLQLFPISNEKIWNI